MSSEFYMKMLKQNVTYKVILVGKNGVGKSCIMTRYISNKFTQKTVSTTGIDFLQKKFHYHQKDVRLQLWDTSGQQVYKDACATRLRKGDCIIFVYDLSDQQSIKNLQQFWIPRAEDCRDEVLFYIFGNKSDLIENQQKRNQIKERVDQKLSKNFQRINIKQNSFIGNCKQQQNKKIKQMMDQILQKLYRNTITKEMKQQEIRKSTNYKVQNVIKKPQPQPTIKLQPQAHKKKSNQNKKKGCLF